VNESCHACVAVTGLASIPLVTYVDLIQRFDSRGYAETLEVSVYVPYRHFKYVFRALLSTCRALLTVCVALWSGPHPAF